MGRKFCPRCKSENVRAGLSATLAVGAPQNWVCNNCGYYGLIFPEKEIKTKVKRNK